ncbi:SigE family RNA polymerase sigma factor [Glycomyces arizonensis]|uniref:SigE family RNA polymerase sigma factor n=1 Tax=Glycomyces arizonensis TaxID=256035 RepID=UPI0003FB527B|nr:SigE family RNA polymerase sigma factor [Glycomyces arizonensis]
MDREQHEAEFRTFAAAQRDSLHKYAYLLCGDWYEADDIVQKSLTKLFAAWRRIEPGGAAAYTRRIVTNTYFSHLRREWVRRERATTELPEPVAHGSPQEAVDTRMEILTALERLPPRQRATVVLRYCEQLTLEETADAMRCSIGTVKSQSSKAIQALRRLLPATPQPEYHGR